MRISFDLDDTLICYGPRFPCEPRLPWYKRWIGGNEPLRQGTRALLLRLQQSGWEIWIYTTSRRNVGAIRRWLRCHGIRVAGIVNQDLHESSFCRQPDHVAPSKNPGAFGIALHIDDSDGVRREGESHGFNVLVVTPDDLNWTEKVWCAAEKLRSLSNRPSGSSQ